MLQLQNEKEELLTNNTSYTEQEADKNFMN